MAAVHANGGNVYQTAKKIGIPEKTLEHWVKSVHKPQAAKDGEEKRGDMADALDRIAWKLLDALEGKIGDAPLSQTATSLGIAIDKARLLRGEPTAITQHDERRTIAAAIFADPAVAAAATARLEQLTSGFTHPGPLRELHVSRQVEVPASPIDAEPRPT